MDLHHTSKFIFLNSQGKKIVAPLEWEPAFLQVFISEENWHQLQIFVQDRKLEVYLAQKFNEKRILANWERSNPGHYRLRFEHEGKVEEQIITIIPRKISPESFTQMLEDLETYLPTSVAIKLQKTGALAGLNLPQLHEHTFAQEILLLRRAMNGTENRAGLIKILSTLAHEHYKILKNNEIWVRQEQVRKPSANGLIQSFCRGHNLDANKKPIQVLDVRVEHTVDIYENQLVKLFFELVYQRLRRIESICEADAKNYLLKEVKCWVKQLKKARKEAIFLNEVTQLKSWTNQITMVLLKRPAYHSALEGYLEFIKSPTVHLDNPYLDTPLENLPKLYQVWCTLWVIKALLEIAEQKGYKVKKQCLVGRDKTGIYVRVFPNNQSVLVLTHPHHNIKIELFPERSYGENGELSSATFTQRPDIALEIQLADGSYQVYLFDPKYKLESENTENIDIKNKPKKEDIDKMHTYSHAIRDPKGQHVVKYAAILYPGFYYDYPHAQIQALRAYPGQETELKKYLYKVLNIALEGNTRLMI